MRIIPSFLCLLFLILTNSSLEAKCDCNGNEIITVCQNGVTKRVNCSAHSDPNVFCGPCNQKPDCKPGEKCNDGNECTKWDKYDSNCNCIGQLADADDDGVCDAVDRCPNGDDLLDENKNGMPDECENQSPPKCSSCPSNDKGEITICFIPHNRSKMKTVEASCEWLTSFFNKDGSLKGDNKCGPCKCEYAGDKDSDGDGVCDKNDQCPDDPNNKCNSSDPNDPSACDTECSVKGDSEYEWIDKISMNQLENQTGDDGGYGNYKHLVLELGQGDSLSLWLFPGYLGEAEKLSMVGYIDWNNDCDFDDPGEIVFDNRTNGENGADIAIPTDATVGDLTVRFIVHNGRLKSPCHTCIEGEVEDYTLRVFRRSNLTKPLSLETDKKRSKSLEVFPNPIFENNPYIVKLGDQNVALNNLKIYNITGGFLENKKLEPGENDFNAKRLSPGLYIFELSSEKGIFRETVVVTK